MYDGLKYKLSLEFPNGYPYNPPTVKFVTPCFHPNVDQHGNICLDILKEKWSALYDVRTILISIQSLLAGKRFPRVLVVLFLRWKTIVEHLKNTTFMSTRPGLTPSTIIWSRFQGHCSDNATCLSEQTTNTGITQGSNCVTYIEREHPPYQSIAKLCVQLKYFDKID